MDLIAALASVVDTQEPAPAVPFDLVEAIERAAPGLKSAPEVAPRKTVSATPLVQEAEHRPMRGAALAQVVDAMCKADPAREPWPASWFTVTDSADGFRCLQLWAEVLRVCLSDACDETITTFDLQAEWDAKPVKLRRGPRPELRLSWVATSDFMQVCALAGLDGQAVRDRVVAKLASREGAAELGRGLSAQVTGAVRKNFARDAA